jgi:hypothetical protein
MSEDIKKYINLFESTREVEYTEYTPEVVEEDHDEPASPEEANMAGDQAEFIKYAIEEIKDSIERGDDFPEWFQNKLSGVYTTMKSLHGWMEGDSRNDADDEYSAKFDELYGKDKDILDNLSIRKEDKEFDLDDLNNAIDSL